MRVTSRYEMNWANSFFSKNSGSLVYRHMDGRTDRRTDRCQGKSSILPFHFRWCGAYDKDYISKYRESHYKIRRSWDRVIFYDGSLHTGYMIYLYWNSPQSYIVVVKVVPLSWSSILWLFLRVSMCIFFMSILRSIKCNSEKFCYIISQNRPNHGITAV